MNLSSGPEEDVAVVRANAGKIAHAKIQNPAFGTTKFLGKKDMEVFIKDWDRRQKVIKILGKESFSSDDLAVLYSVMEAGDFSCLKVPNPDGSGFYTNSNDLVRLVLPKNVQEMWEERDRLFEEVVDNPELYEELEKTQKQFFTKMKEFKGFPSSALNSMYLGDGSTKDLERNYHYTCLYCKTNNPVEGNKNLAILKKIDPVKYKNKTLENYC